MAFGDLRPVTPRLAVPALPARPLLLMLVMRVYLTVSAEDVPKRAPTRATPNPPFITSLTCGLLEILQVRFLKGEGD